MEPVANTIAPIIVSNRGTTRTRGAGAIGRKNVSPKIELLCPERVAMVSPLHVLIDLGNRQIEAEIHAHHRPRKENDEHREGSVLEIGHLNFHRPELYPPTDRRINWRGFELHGLVDPRIYALRDTRRQLQD